MKKLLLLLMVHRNEGAAAIGVARHHKFAQRVHGGVAVHDKFARSKFAFTRRASGRIA